jgi:alpha-acetolactate decarboxylase
MKKIIITFVFFLVSNAFFAQSDFDKYDGQDGVGSIIVNKKMFQMMGSVKVDSNDKETQQYLELIKKLDNLKVFTSSNAKVSADMKITAEKYMKSVGLEEMMKVTDNGKNLKVWVKSGASESQIKELLLFSVEPNKNNESVLMSLTGNFNINDIAILMNKMKIPGGDDLKKATKEK